ncbi:Group 1 truncated hemoglobin [Balamuthia mandrillaris]
MPQTKAEAERTLYDELGGEAAIDAAVDKFYEKVLADERVNFFFDGVDMRRQARMQKGFLIFALGGPRRYTGKGMKVVHERLVKEKGLNDLHFDAIIELLSQTLREMGVSEENIAKVGAKCEPLRGPILGRE